MSPISVCCLIFETSSRLLDGLILTCFYLVIINWIFSESDWWSFSISIEFPYLQLLFFYSKAIAFLPLIKFFDLNLDDILWLSLLFNLLNQFFYSSTHLNSVILNPIILYYTIHRTFSLLESFITIFSFHFWPLR